MKLPSLGLRVWILIAAILLSVVFINPRPLTDGVAITAIDRDSPAAAAALEGPSAATAPVMRERILALNGMQVTSVADYERAAATVEPGSLVQVRTTRDSYVLQTANGSSALGIRVSEPSTNNIRKGLDLTGGARVLLQPEEEVDDATMDLLLENIEQRLNVFGLSDVVVRPMQDFSGNSYILVEIAGVNEQEIIDLLARQGEFVARIGNRTVFTGGDDITHVGRSAIDSGLQACTAIEGGAWQCQFYFVISLSAEAAQRHADITGDLRIVQGPTGGYLSEPLDLFLDGENISSLQIASSLRGRAETQIQITGSETGPTQETAAQNAQSEMKKLQTVLATGSLPVNINLVKIDTISPALGADFMRNIWLVGIAAMVAVMAVVALRYRDLRVIVPMFVAMVSEVVLVLGLAALVGWSLDLAGIAGILVAIGTGVDDQIVIIDELKTKRRQAGTMKQRMKKAFFIIFAAFFTLLAAMLPLVWAGAGLVRGFAITTILGVTVGVLVTRPAFAQIAERILGTEKQA